ncbi:LOW QUALITY PROTEIN: uncharacterized protein [Hemitrygon akajei]|uniref:LOW QUALITY PROTEIN: uncharacterized protein n=1 Tax=Hemitrygon akajei TaxID=2704970 RepID=UPI003BFA023E
MCAPPRPFLKSMTSSSVSLTSRESLLSRHHVIKLSTTFLYSDTSLFDLRRTAVVPPANLHMGIGAESGNTVMSIQGVERAGGGVEAGDATFGSTSVEDDHDGGVVVGLLVRKSRIELERGMLTPRFRRLEVGLLGNIVLEAEVSSIKNSVTDHRGAESALSAPRFETAHARWGGCGPGAGGRRSVENDDGGGRGCTSGGRGGGPAEDEEEEVGPPAAAFVVAAVAPCPLDVDNDGLGVGSSCLCGRPCGAPPQLELPARLSPHFECAVCCKAFPKASYLAQHQRVHSGERPYCCPACPKRFARSFELTRHRRIHTGEKPYQCPLCPRRFYSSGNLSQHRRVHTGEKPYRCSLCQRPFAKSSNLVEHLRTHTLEKPFECALCRKLFRNAGGLAKHRYLHSGRKPSSAPSAARASCSGHTCAATRPPTRRLRAERGAGTWPTPVGRPGLGCGGQHSPLAWGLSTSRTGLQESSGT